MEDAKEAVLPYRTTGEELGRLIEARARGRELPQIQALNFSAGNFQGTLVAAVELDFLDGDSKELSEAGRAFALADSDGRRALLLEALLRFEPYDLLLEAVFDRGNPRETTLEWIQTWWSTQGYGNSQTNREEGSSAFAKLLEYAGLGSYVQGRRGHPTRVLWLDETPVRIKQLRRPVAGASRAASAETPPPPPSSSGAVAGKQPSAGDLAEGPAGATENSRLVLQLDAGRVVELSLPPRITAAEKRRVLSILELMIRVPDEGGAPSA
ncbi:MAG: hypothetical protein M3409_03895 [Gemmatimonadota bacterium]|nr:hypothetical protein [Gemmatimonadota bacterium]